MIVAIEDRWFDTSTLLSWNDVYKRGTYKNFSIELNDSKSEMNKIDY